jgi:hypothetical protein
MCAGHSLLPRSLQIKVWCDRSDIPHCRGGFADVWKGTHGDREVAVKVLRIRAGSDSQKITRVSRSGALAFNKTVETLTGTCVGVLQGVPGVESP